MISLSLLWIIVGSGVYLVVTQAAPRSLRHMNVLLAEANVPYEQLHELEAINPFFRQADIVLVVGASNVTNPAAKSNKSSPLFGMPILEVDHARSIIVLKRSMRPGFASVDNDLYYNEEVHECCSATPRTASPRSSPR